MDAESTHPLTAWLDESGLDRNAFARDLGVTRMALRRYESGERKPEWNVLNRIVLLTGGAVDANAWLGKEAADAVARRALA